MFQATQQNTIVWARCVLGYPNRAFKSKRTTDSDGLAIYPRGDPGIPMHLGAAAFGQAAQTMEGMRRAAQKHPAFSKLARRLMLSKSKRRADQDTVTCRSSNCSSSGQQGEAMPDHLVLNMYIYGGAAFCKYVS